MAAKIAVKTFAIVLCLAACFLFLHLSAVAFDTNLVYGGF